ncbi:hypothetical protein [Winogradskyella bathintestinalis]|uniref:Uncharacterized protein n=1 Tax=Winogradskyella bathintestinalis TaxID=3035208 RepID=A0ABT7ZXZ5_9FLAO|nr:hypothetical protein [Winogradskyella bathintestinalis]MDN3493704.1 hypothetical protein [Winogradskyella bathintestinalis]
MKTVITTLFKLLAIILVIVVLLPSAVKFSHVFTHHTHVVCQNDSSSDTHFHESDLECDFYKFKLSKQLYIQHNTETLTSVEDNFNITDSQYQFVSDFQKLQIALRGPPQMI